ncbi:MAG: efflux RND transporter permease subunit [Anaerovoracaceae bacterium]
MPKFSVKKPLTVFVAAVIIIVLGVVSFTKMTPDLLPNMDMPYVIVMTPYPGAAPEKVETAITKPLEQSLATLENIKNVQSMSSSNYSMVMLEFNNDVNMDTVSVDILQKINIIEGNWEETVGTPTILKMNPSMMPISVAAVSFDGKSQTELSNFVKDTLLNKLEGTSGVASISAGGILDEKVNVVLSQDKIDKINNQVLGSINSNLAKAEREINKGKKEINQGLAKVADGRTKLEAGATYIPEEQYKEATAKLDKTEKQLKDGLKEINKQSKQIESQGNQARANANVGDKITAEMISNILKAQNFSMPAGYVEDDGTKYLVSVGDEIITEKEAKNIYLFKLGIAGIEDVRLNDVADVFMKNNAKDIYATINGENGVVLSFSKQSNIATAEVSKNINEKFEELSKEYKGVEFTTLMDQGDYIQIVISSILTSLLWGALFAILILLLFLRDLKPTIITLCSIPISLIFAIVMMYFSGITINLLSLSGLAVAVGMLVDNSVVVIENIFRLRRQGVPPAKAAVAGAKQVAGAITASTLTTICVFVPIIFTDGITRQLFTDMALTVAYSLIASLIIALTLVPAAASKMLINVKDYEGKRFTYFLDKYKQSARFALHHRGIVLGLALVLLVGSAGLTLAKGFIFMPEMSSPQISVTMEMPEGTKLNDTKAMADKVIKKVETVKEVDTVGAILANGGMMGMSAGGQTDATKVSMYVMLDEKMKRTSGEIADEINDICKDFPCIVTASGSSMGDFTTALGGQGVSINVYGTDLKELQNTAIAVGKKLETVKGVEEVENGIVDPDREIHFVIDKTKAMKEGVTVAQVYGAVVAEMKTEETSTSVNWEGDNYDVIVSSDTKNQLNPKDMEKLVISVKDPSGKEKNIKLSDISRIEETDALSSIGRDNQTRFLTVKAMVSDGYNVTRVTADAEKAISQLKISEDSKVEFSGENEMIMDAMKDMVKMLLLGIIFIYMIMVAQFQSLKSPFIIMFTIPLAFTGGLLALLLTGKEISVIAMVGFVMLCGIIVNNGIVLVDYINQLRGHGMAKKEAIIQAGATRMRPILMTSLTTILGLVVMALGKTAGTDMMQPIAIVCIGGLLYATLLTLYVVPVIYDLINKEEYNHLTDEDLDITGIQ